MTSLYSTTVSVLLGNGDGTFRAKTDVAVGDEVSCVAIADLNADGRPDLAVATHHSNAVSVLLGNGDGTFGTRTDFSIAGSGGVVAIADLNADGRPDLVTSHDCSNGCISMVSVLLGNGDGTFGTELVIGNYGAGALAIADLNGDGRLDLAMTNGPSNTVSVLLGNGDGTFGTKADFGTGIAPAAVAIADLNGDGRPDLAVADTGPYNSKVGDFVGPGTVSVLLGNGDGTFGAKTDFVTERDAVSLAIADLNGDGRPDLAVGTSGGHGYFSTTVSVLLGNGEGTFATRTDFETGQGPEGVAIADLNADGRPDLVVASTTSDAVSVLLGNGGGTFGTRTEIAVGASLQEVAIADLNADGQPDLVLACYNGVALMLLGNGDGTFGPITALTSRGYTYYSTAIAIADLNADGRPDLVMTTDSCEANICFGTVSVLLGNGDGTFQARTHVGTWSSHVSVAIADLNADGRPDLAVANQGANTISVLLGNGDGTFFSTIDCGTGSFPSSVAIADLNADGRPDLVVANHGVYPLPGTVVSVLLGNGDGTFRTRTDYDAGSYPLSVTIADLDADGRPDLVVVNEYSDTVSVLLGNGDGTFGRRTGYVTGSAPYSVTIADLNADGRLDLVMASDHHENAGNVSVLLGNGDGSFGTRTAYGSYSPSSVAVADLNADGRPDLAVAQWQSGTVEVLLNTGANTTGVVPPPPAMPLAFGLFAPRPNPSLGTSEIRFVLPSSRPVEIDLFDVTGRRVWSWASQANLSAGAHTVTWSGRDASGRAARSGVYLLDVRAGRDRGVKRLVLQR